MPMIHTVSLGESSVAANLAKLLQDSSYLFLMGFKLLVN